MLKLDNKADYIEWNNLRDFIKKTEKDGYSKISLFATLSTFFALRISETLSLKWKDILDKNQFILTEIKTNSKKQAKQRLITINPDIQKKIKSTYNKWNQPGKNQYIFLNQNETKIISKQYVNRRIKELFDKYNIPYQNLSSHSFRKSFCREYLRKHNYSNYAFEIIRDLLNHRDIYTTKKYLGIWQEEIQSVYHSFRL
jgi:site-specific recombinase XerD